MDWSAYYGRFRREAHKAGYDKDYIKRCLDYAKVLYRRSLPIIYDQEHLSLLVGYSVDYLRRASNASRAFYREFLIIKKSGGLRTISEPLPSLKEIQRWILDNILYKCKVSKFAKGFKKGLSIKDNARFHRGQKMVLSLDIRDFFSSIPSDDVYDFFRSLGYCKSICVMLTNLCTLNRCLPQGAPTSPALSNLLNITLDRRLAGFALKYKLRYTRYADDITFSGEFDPGNVIRFVVSVLKDENLELNYAKTRLMLSHQRQEVTGIVVNKYMQAPREFRRALRQYIFYIEKYGLYSHMERRSIDKANHLRHLIGIANHILFLNPNDRDAKHAIKVLQ